MHDRKRLVPDGFTVPEGLEHPRFRLRMLTVEDVIKDYDAVMTSVEHLQDTYSPESGSVWPDGLTLKDDLIDLGWHQREFTMGYSFAYTIMSLDESRCLGCMYINPTRKRDHDVKVTLWVRADELESGLDEELHQAVKDWVARDWPFSNPGYPGRATTFAKWAALPNEA